MAFKEKYGLQDKFVIMYSGNIGLYYDLENLMKVVEGVKPGTKTADGREVAFAFVGSPRNLGVKTAQPRMNTGFEGGWGA